MPFQPMSCSGCAQSAPNQLAHMEDDGCLHVPAPVCSICTDGIDSTIIISTAGKSYHRACILYQFANYWGHNASNPYTPYEIEFEEFADLLDDPEMVGWKFKPQRFTAYTNDCVVQAFPDISDESALLDEELPPIVVIET